MRGTTALRGVFVLVLVVAPLVPVVVLDESQATAAHSPDLDERLRPLVGQYDGVTSDPVDRQVLVVVELKNGSSIPADRMRVQRVYSREGARLLRGYVPLSSVRDLSHDPRIEAVRIQQSRAVATGRVADGVAAIGADDLHEAGLTGENVTVGVVDSGFRLSNREIAGNVGAYRSFDAEGDAWRHGTAVASVVVDTAPAARLHLAAVGTSTTPEEYRRAVEWLQESGADVILDAGSYFGQPGDGSGAIARIAANASEETLFVTSAGNYGRRHWAGTDNASAGRRWVTFGDQEGNMLNDGAPLSGRVTVSLHWDEWPTDDDYDLYLFRKRPGEDTVVASSEDAQNGSAPVEYLSTTVPHGRYYVAVRGDGVEGTHRLELFASHELEHRTPVGSLTAPATAAGVFVVGATEDGEVAAFSSRGPVAGRTGVDVVAPDSVAATGIEAGGGTSYAAPYAAGLAALLYDRHPSLTDEEMGAIMRSAAVDVGPPGVDPASGYGRLDAQGAVELADAAVRYDPINSNVTA